MKKSIWLTFLSICFIGAFSSATAQEIGLQAIGGGLGMSDYQGGVGSAVMFEGAAALGTVAENLNLDARVVFWSKSEGSVSFRDFIIGAAVSYALGSGDSKIQPYAGGGLSLHFFKADVDVDLGGIFGTQSSSATSTDIGIDLRGGAKYGLNEKTDLVGEIMYTLGDAEQLAIKVGALFKLSK